MEKSIKRIVKSTINTVLGPAGLAIAQKKRLRFESDAAEVAHQYARCMKEAEKALRALLLPELTECKGRHLLMTELIGCGMIKAFYLFDYLHRSLKQPGAVCEFGVAEGATSALIANEILDTDRDLWLFDSFQGLPKPTEKDVLIHDIYFLGAMEKYEGWMAHPVNLVKTRLENISFPNSRLKIVPGFIEKNKNTSNFPAQVCFAYLDFDFYEPILIALNLLHSRLSSGGTVLVDDYMHFSAGAKTAVDEFLQQYPAEYTLTLPGSFTAGFVMLTKK